jgi:phosphoglycerate kinase
MNYIKDQKNLDGKIVLLRLDLNVPLKNGIITDDTRIVKILPTLEFLIKNNSKIIIISHIGRPKGEWNDIFSMKPVCEYINKKINKRAKLIKKNIFQLKKEQLFLNSEDQVLFLENIRFYKNEEENDMNFSKHLASLGDLFINDAFSCSHRAHASISEITKYIPSYAGIQFEAEVDALEKVTKNIKKPITCIIGGSKISSKISIIKNLIPRFDNIIIVGGMANNLLKYKGHSIGKSIQEANCETSIDDIFKKSKSYPCSIILPEDVAVGKRMDDNATIKELNQIENDDIILDIGPKTINKIKSIINKSKTILWNGPAGYFENPQFSKGSFEIGNQIANQKKLDQIFSVAGGGDTFALINNIDIFDNFNFVSTAGGAFLEYLEGKELPGIKALN